MDDRKKGDSTDNRMETVETRAYCLFKTYDTQSEQRFVR
jgi:hypothetical protein